MTRDELINRLKGYEWTDFECKKARADVPKDAYSTVSAFANTQGGWLLLGVSESAGRLEVTGIEPAAFDQMQNAFLTTLRSGQKLNYLIDAQPHVYELEGKRILAFYIPEAHRYHKPIYLNGNLRESYLRRAARDERMTENELRRFLRDSAQQSWDGEGMPDFPFSSSIDTETLQWYQDQFVRRNPEHRHIADPQDFLLEWNFAVHQAGTPVLTRAGILLFGVDRCVRALLPRPVLDYQRIDTRFDDWSSDQRWHDRLVFEENLFKTWRGLVAKYSRIAEHPFSVDPATLRRNDDPPDYIAFREAAINLLIHQDYGDHNRKASLKWFTDRLIFWNPGDAFANVAQLLESNEKDIRNPLIVNAFRRIGLSDQAGTGIRSILRNWCELGRRTPQINNNKTDKFFELILVNEPLITEGMQRFQSSLGVVLTAEQAAILAMAASQSALNVTDAAIAAGGNIGIAYQSLEHMCRQQLLTKADQATYSLPPVIRARLERFESQVADEVIRDNKVALEVTPEVTPEVAPQVTSQVLSMLRIMEGDMSRAQLMAALGLKDEKHFREYYQQAAISQGIIEMTIPDKPRSSKQKYRITDKGKTVLEHTQHGTKAT
ncbi:MAG: Fic family protein [Desulfobulbus sp.]|jgi:ATP-dependent DNA helicase RecG